MNRDLFIVMGVAGAGKTRIGSALAAALGVVFVEGDDYHPPENVARMAAGIPLTDADRLGWLRTLADRLARARAEGVGIVMSCSALKRSYRDFLRAAAGDVRFIYLRGPATLVAERLAGRRGHYMPPSLLDSQFAALEEPAPEEHAWVCDIGDSADAIVSALARRATT